MATTTTQCQIQKPVRYQVGSLAPFTLTKKDKVYPVVSGSRVPITEAHKYPKHFYWQFVYKVKEGKKWVSKSKWVPGYLLARVRGAIDQQEPCERILTILKEGKKQGAKASDRRPVKS